MPKEDIALSTVPPDAAPAPCMRMDLPYAVALRDLFGEYKMRAQQNTRYMESDAREATVAHVMNLMISRLTTADIQSTITPDEGRNVPWHYNNVAAVDTAKQALVGMDGLREMVTLDRENPELAHRVREIKERAVLFLEAMLADGGYFAGVEEAYFVDSGEYPETNDDGIARASDGGVAEGTIVPRARRLPRAGLPPLRREPPARRQRREAVPRRSAAARCATTTKVPFIDELDPTDNVNVAPREDRRAARARPDQARGRVGRRRRRGRDDVPAGARERVAEAAALEIGRAMNLARPRGHPQAGHAPGRGHARRAQGRLDVAIDPATLVIPEPPEPLTDEEIREFVAENEPALRRGDRRRGRALGRHARDHRHQARRPREVGLRLHVPGHVGADREGARRRDRARGAAWC